jgi:hypothetical protein
MSNMDYFLRRACDEHAAAMRAASSQARHLHLELAREYARRAATEPDLTASAWAACSLAASDAAPAARG